MIQFSLQQTDQNLASVPWSRALMETGCEVVGKATISYWRLRQTQSLISVAAIPKQIQSACHEEFEK
jgi:hypothetical protein